MKKFLKPSLLSMTLALTLAFAASPLTSHAAEIVPVVQATTAVSSPVVSLQGKKVSILGDSLSTFTGTMPDDYNVYYPEHGDIPNADQTWWGQLLTNTGMVLCSNASSANTDVTGNSLAMDGSAPGCSIRRVMDLRGTDGSSPEGRTTRCGF